MMDEERRIDFTRWHQCVEWHDIMVPVIEAQEAVQRRNLFLANPRDPAEVATFQGFLQALDWLKTLPQRELDKARREDEEREDAAQRREDRRTVRRLLAWTRGR